MSCLLLTLSSGRRRDTASSNRRQRGDNLTHVSAWEAEADLTNTERILPDEDEYYTGEDVDQGIATLLGQTGWLELQQEKESFALNLQKLGDPDDSDKSSESNAVSFDQSTESGKIYLTSSPLCARDPHERSRSRTSTDSAFDEEVEHNKSVMATPVQRQKYTTASLTVTPENKSTISSESHDSVHPLKPGRKKKKKPRMSRNQRRNNSSTTTKKVSPKLELPEPIPTPGASNTGNAWNDVVRKGVAKADKRIQNDAVGRVKQREMVNASSYLLRSDENEVPTRGAAAVDVRFGIGNAKHDVRRIVPRSVLD